MQTKFREEHRPHGAFAFELQETLTREQLSQARNLLPRLACGGLGWLPLLGHVVVCRFALSGLLNARPQNGHWCCPEEGWEIGIIGIIGCCIDIEFLRRLLRQSM